MEFYKVLNKQNFVSGNYSIVPIRYIDRFDIMKWRNEQIYHLRQNKPLTIQDQEVYFKTVVGKLFMKIILVKFYFLFWKITHVLVTED